MLPSNVSLQWLAMMTSMRQRLTVQQLSEDPLKLYRFQIMSTMTLCCLMKFICLHIILFIPPAVWKNSQTGDSRKSVTTSCLSCAIRKLTIKWRQELRDKLGSQTIWCVTAGNTIIPDWYRKFKCVVWIMYPQGSSRHGVGACLLVSVYSTCEQ